ncbi:MAG TPA: DUF4956 domain-containing protein [Sphingomicrobium sp.]|jgi:hypothetical protein|nr:DUF4956 domain-containing protein [Sphingomicrobium sp.]
MKVFLQITLYYLALILGLVVLQWLFPTIEGYLPIGGAEALIRSSEPDLLKGTAIGATEVRTMGESLLWLIAAIIGALLTALPVSWVYMEIREEHQYDQALDSTIVMMPVVVTGIVVIVQHSLALAFSLAGIAGAVRFRNSLKSSGDAVFILLAIGIGLAAGIGAVELAFVMSLGFNYCFMLLWLRDYGGRGEKRYMRSSHETTAAPNKEAGD